MSITWVVAADTTVAKIYALGQVKGELMLLKTLENPEGRFKSGEIGFDKPGQFENPMHGQSETFERANTKQVELHQFAHKIAQTLESGRVEHAYTQLIIVIGPHLHGIVTQELNKHVAALVHKNIQKDYMQLPLHELYQHVIEVE